MRIILTESQFKRVILSEASLLKTPNCYELGNRRGNTPAVKANAYDIQRFFDEVGHNISIDGDFGDKSAKSFGTFHFGGKSGIDTLDKLYVKLKSKGYDVGDKPGFGPKMAKVISDILSKWVVNKSYEWCLKRVLQVMDYNEKIAEKSKKEFCLNNKDKALGEIKTLWLNWVDHPATSEKLGQQLKSRGLNPLLLKGYLISFKSEINSFKSSQLYCRTEKEDDYLAEEKPNAYQQGDIIVLNCDTTKINTYEGMKNTLNHEFSHYLEHKVDHINNTEYWKKSLPLIQQGWDINQSRGLSQFILNVVDTEEFIDESTISSFKTIGVTKSDLIYWLDQVKNYGEDYNCRHTEKESNLKSIRLYYCNNLHCDLKMEQIREMLSYDNIPQEVSSNVYHLMMCWATNRFKPSPKEFLNGLNDLALGNDVKGMDNIT